MVATGERRLKQTLELSDQVLFQEIDGEAVLLDLRSERYFGLDEVGTRVWQLLTERHGDLHAVYADLLGEYEVDAASLQGDLARFIERLINARLARLADAQ